jgi:pyrrolidone-carboxylate peptidase
MSTILLYTFNVPTQIAYKLVKKFEDQENTFYLGSLKNLKNTILENKFDYILGLGNYSKHAKNIRIESSFVNRYGNKEIVKGGQYVYIAGWELKKEDGVVKSVTSTQGPCNRSAYVISELIERKVLHTKLGFIHIPKNFNSDKAYTLIHNWLNAI